MNEDRCAIGTEVVCYAESSADEHGGRRIRCHLDKKSLLLTGCSFLRPAALRKSAKLARLIVGRLSEIDFTSSLAKSQPPERAQIGTFESPLSAFSTISGLYTAPRFSRLSNASGVTSTATSSAACRMNPSGTVSRTWMAAIPGH